MTTTVQVSGLGKRSRAVTALDDVSWSWPRAGCTCWWARMVPVRPRCCVCWPAWRGQPRARSGSPFTGSRFVQTRTNHAEVHPVG